MKKWILGSLSGVICVMMLMHTIGLAEDFYNPTSPIVEAPELWRQYQQNKFAFAKNWGEKQVIVGGLVDSVDEGRIDGAFGKSPYRPYVMLQGLFHAFIDNPVPELDLANIQENDAFLFVCRDLREGYAGLYLQGICIPATQSREIEGKPTLTYLTKDPDM